MNWLPVKSTPRFTHSCWKRLFVAIASAPSRSENTIAVRGGSPRQETLAESAREIQKLGAELYDRLRVMSGHMQTLQRSLGSTVEAYNRAVGSFESRVLVSARKFPSLGVTGSEIPDLAPIETAPRHLQAYQPDLYEDDSGPIPIVALPEGGANTGT